VLAQARAVGALHRDAYAQRRQSLQEEAFAGFDVAGAYPDMIEHKKHSLALCQPDVATSRGTYMV